MFTDSGSPGMETEMADASTAAVFGAPVPPDFPENSLSIELVLAASESGATSMPFVGMSTAPGAVESSPTGTTLMEGGLEPISSEKSVQMEELDMTAEEPSYAMSTSDSEEASLAYQAGHALTMTEEVGVYTLDEVERSMVEVHSFPVSTAEVRPSAKYVLESVEPEMEGRIPMERLTLTGTFTAETGDMGVASTSDATKEIIITSKPTPGGVTGMSAGVMADATVDVTIDVATDVATEATTDVTSDKVSLMTTDALSVTGDATMEVKSVSSDETASEELLLPTSTAVAFTSHLTHSAKSYDLSSSVAAQESEEVYVVLASPSREDSGTETVPLGDAFTSEEEVSEPSKAVFDDVVTESPQVGAVISLVSASVEASLSRPSMSMQAGESEYTTPAEFMATEEERLVASVSASMDDDALFASAETTISHPGISMQAEAGEHGTFIEVVATEEEMMDASASAGIDGIDGSTVLASVEASVLLLTMSMQARKSELGTPARFLGTEEESVDASATISVDEIANIGSSASPYMFDVEVTNSAESVATEFVTYESFGVGEATIEASMSSAPFTVWPQPEICEEVSPSIEVSNDCLDHSPGNRQLAHQEQKSQKSQCTQQTGRSLQCQYTS